MRRSFQAATARAAAWHRRWRSRQPLPGTRIIHYRCCLPALAGFANYRRERTNGTAIERGGSIPPAAIPLRKLKWRRGRDSNPRSGYKPLTHFPGVLLQPLGHLSARTNALSQLPGGICSSHPETRPPRCALRPACGCPDSLPANLSNPRSGYKPLTHNPGRTFQACSFNRSDTSPHVDHANSISKRIALARAGEDTGRDQPAQEWGMPQYLNQHAISA